MPCPVARACSGLEKAEHAAADTVPTCHAVLANIPLERRGAAELLSRCERQLTPTAIGMVAVLLRRPGWRVVGRQ